MASGGSTLGATHQSGGTIVRYREFLSDTEKISHDVVVGHTGWETVLENNKQAFVLELCAALPDLATALPTSLTPAQFIDQLNAKCRDVLSAKNVRGRLACSKARRTPANTTARALALRQVSEDEDYEAEFNRAFVFDAILGYLRRNPNDAQDSDYTGYDSWLTKLNQSTAISSTPKWLRLFISSGEYRQRFGPERRPCRPLTYGAYPLINVVRPGKQPKN